ncbi:MAG: hypothetical protein K0S79_59 [Nitrospira sp.]|nr:hypothetical protein [Nitrospira sp.]
MTTLAELEITDEESAGALVINAIQSAPKAVKTQDQYDEAMRYLTDVKLKAKKVEAFWESIKAPLRKAKKEVDDKERKMLEPLEQSKKDLERVAGVWFAAEVARKKAIQDAENKKHEDKVQAAIAAGKDPVAVAPPKVIEQPRAVVQSAGGAMSTMRMVPNWRIKAHPALCQSLARDQREGFYRTDPRLAGLPDSVWELNTTRLAALAKSGTCELLEMYDVPSSTTRG